MTRIVISGYYGFGNAGDEAMLSALLDSIREIIHDADITVITGNRKLTEANHCVHTMGRMDILGIFNVLRRCHILISGGGSLLQDVTSSRSLYYYLAIIKMALFLHKPVMLYAQGIGPLIRPRARTAVRNVLEKVDMICVRDEASRDELQAIGVHTPPIEVTSDAVLSIHPADPAIGQGILEKFHIPQDKKKIGMCIRNWKNMTRYKAEIATAADALQQQWNAEIIFIPMQFPDDIAAAKDIQQQMKNPSTILADRYSTTELMSLIGAMDILFGIRLHALVFAALMQVPEAAISYDPKIDRFIKMIGDELCGTIDSVKAEDICHDINQKLSAGKPSQAIVEKVAQLRELSRRNAYLALSVIKKHSEF